ncbi:MAG: O-antigen polymerase [Tissierellia bacterium]|nr:O-antigen polymerase [Tissierellia bacterium]
MISFDLMNLSIIVISIIFVILGTLLFRKAAGNLNPMTINPISGAYYFLLFLSVLGTTLFLLGITHHTSRYMTHGNIKQIAWLTTLILFVVFPSVIIVLNKLFKYDTGINLDYQHRDVKIYENSNSEFITMLIATVVVVSAVIYTYAMIGINNSPVYNLIIGTSPEKLGQLRNMADSGFPGNQYIKNIFAIALTPFISYIAYIYMRKTKEKRWILLFIILFIASNLIAFYNIQKAPIIIYWGSFLILSMYYGDKIKLKYFIAICLISVIAIIIMYMRISGSTLDRILSFQGPINRIIMTTPSSYILHLEVFTYRTPLLYGASLPNPLGRLIFGYDSVVRSGRVVMETVNFYGIRIGTSGVYNGLFLGEAYANFGKWGVFASMIHVPIVFFIVNYIFVKLKKTPITIALFTYWTVNLLFTINGGYFDYVFSMIWTLVTLTAIAMAIFNKILRKFNI